MVKRIAFVVCQHSIESNPVLISAVRCFVKNGIHVDIYLENLLENKEFRIDGATIFNFDIQFHRGKIFKKIFRRVNDIFVRLDNKFQFGSSGKKKFILQLLVLAFKPNIFVFGKKLKSYLNNYDYYIVADAFSFLPFYLNCKKDELGKVIYWSLELSDDMKRSFIKEVITRNLSLFRLSIIQDEYREKSLNRFLGLNHEFLKVPVSSIPPDRSVKRDFFQKKYGIEDKFILLYSGTICSWAGLLEVSEVFKEVDDGFLLFIQGRTQGDISYLNQLKAIIKDENNIMLVPRYFDDEEHNWMLGSADAGLAFYLHDGQNDNFNFISNSSGKIAKYLGSGLPVITNNIGGVDEFAEGTESLFCLRSISELKDTLKTIRDNKDQIRDNCIECFNAKYNFNIFFHDIYSLMGY